MAKPKKICKHCQGKIPEGRAKHTCSDHCAREHKANMIIQKNEYNRDYYCANKVHKGSVEVKCDICEKRFDTDTNRKYCSDICSAEGKKRRQTEYMREYRESKRIDKIKIEDDFSDIVIPKKFLTRY